MLILVGKFNLKITQFNVINIFIYADLDKTVFMKMPLRYDKQNKIFKLNKILYSLHQSFFLWQQNLINKIKKVGSKKIPLELYMVQKKILFAFYIWKILCLDLKKISIIKLKKLLFYFQKQ